jgi:hypothetical protein
VAIGATQRRFKPSALLSATNFDGASIVPTAAVVSSGEADSDASADCDIEGAGAAPSSVSVPDLDQTIIANKTIPTTTANTTRPEAPCLGAAAGFEGATALAATGAAATGREEVTVTLGAAAFFALFFTGRFAALFFLATFFAAAFLAGAFFAVFLATLFFTARFAVVFFLATDFFAADFFATAFLAGAFLATFFFAALFFFTATSTPWIVVRTSKTRVYRTRLPQAPQHLYDMRRN